MRKVGIIGGSGFIGSYITQSFLDNGFEVKVGVTDISQPQKYTHLTELPHADYLQIVEVKAEETDQVRHFIQDCDVLIHGGTPFQLDVLETQKELLDPTIQGTKNILEVANHTPSIEKVVFVASVAAYNTNFPLPGGGKSVQAPTDENSQKFFSSDSHPYAQAKYFANHVVEEFITAHPDLHFEISSVSPTMVCGAPLSNREDSVSSSLQQVLKHKLKAGEFVQFLIDADIPLAIVDVRDVAEAVYRLAVTKGLHGKNYLLCSETWRVSDVNLMLENKTPRSPLQPTYLSEQIKSDLSIYFRPVSETFRYFNSH